MCVRDLSPAMKRGWRSLWLCSCCHTRRGEQRGQSGPTEEELGSSVRNRHPVGKVTPDTVHPEYPGATGGGDGSS